MLARQSTPASPRSVTWMDPSFRAVTAETDLASQAAFEAATQVKLDSDVEATRLESELRTLLLPVSGERVGPKSSQRQLDAVAGLARQYVARYQIAAKSIATQEAQDPGPGAADRRFLQRLADRSSQAAILARRGARDRYVLIYTAPDRTGILADISRAVAGMLLNVEAATMAVVADVVTTALVVSAPPSIERPGDLLAREQDDASLIVQSLYEAVATALTSNGRSVDGLKVVPRPITPEVVWPKPGSSTWHINFVVQSVASIAGIFGELAGRDLAVLGFSAWTEGGSYVVDLTFAHAPYDRNGALTRSDEMVADLTDSLEKHTGRGSLSLSPASWPTRTGPIPPVRPVGDATIFTAIGDARPGFVFAILSGMTETHSTGFSFVGGNMAVLEGVSVVSIVLGPTDQAASVAIRESIDERLGQLRSDRSESYLDAVLEPCHVNQPRSISRHWATHRLTVASDEQPGVLAQVASLVSDPRVDANIVWLSSYVLDPRVGEYALRCWLQIHLNVQNVEQAEYLALSLAELAEARQWFHELESILPHPRAVVGSV